MRRRRRPETMFEAVRPHPLPFPSKAAIAWSNRSRWEVLSFPAIAETDETHVIESPLGRRFVTRKNGEVLQPERESKATLITMRETIGSYNFESQYQQSPVPLGGNMIRTDWLRYYDPGELPERSTKNKMRFATPNFISR